jgi:hypothetical protein
MQAGSCSCTWVLDFTVSVFEKKYDNATITSSHPGSLYLAFLPSQNKISLHV